MLPEDEPNALSARPCRWLIRKMRKSSKWWKVLSRQKNAAKCIFRPGQNKKGSIFLAKRSEGENVSRLSLFAFSRKTQISPANASFSRFYAKPPKSSIFVILPLESSFWPTKIRCHQMGLFNALVQMRMQPYTGWTRAKAHPPSNIFARVGL